MSESINEGRKIEIISWHRKNKSTITATAKKFKVHRNSVTRWNKELPEKLPTEKWSIKKDMTTGQEEYVLNVSKDIEDKALALSVDMQKIIETSAQLMLDYLLELKKIKIETNKKVTPTDYNRIMKIMNTVLPYTVPSASSSARAKQPEDSNPKTSVYESFKQLYTDLEKSTKKPTPKPN